MTEAALPSDDQRTRSRMVRAAAELLQRRGWYGTGVADILALAGAPRGSLYHHFPGGKRQLAVEGVRYTGRIFANQLEEAARTAIDLKTYLVTLGELSSRDLKATDFEAACPVAATALDVPQNETEIVSACSDAFSLWVRVIEAGLRQYMVTPTRAPMLARLVATALLGATMLSRADRDVAAINRTVADLMETAGLVDSRRAQS